MDMAAIQLRLDRLEAFCKRPRGIDRTWSGGQVQYPPPSPDVLRDCAAALSDVADVLDCPAIRSELAVALAEVGWLCQVAAAAVVLDSGVLEWQSDTPDLVQWSATWAESLAAADPWGLF